MQIKTALAIGSGIAIGVIIGMGVSEDTKYKALGKIRKTLIYALGGEVKKPYTTFRNTTYANYNKACKGTYANYYQTYKEKRVDIPDQELLKFDDYDSALKCKEDIEKYIDAYKVLSVCDLAHMREKTLDYTWDVYGWKKEDLEGREDIIECADHKYILDLPRPKLLK